MKALDEQTYIVVVEARAPVLRRTAFSLCGDWHLADDLLQKTLLKPFTAWPLRENGAVDAWLTRTLVRTYNDETRRGWWRRERVSDDLPDLPAPLQGTRDEGGLLEQPAAPAPRQLACIILRFLEDFSVEQAAEALACSEGTIRSQASRGLAALAQLRNAGATAPSYGGLIAQGRRRRRNQRGKAIGVSAAVALIAADAQRGRSRKR